MGRGARRAWAALALVAGVGLASSPARGEPRRGEAARGLVYRAPAGCPDEAGFRRELAARAPEGREGRFSVEIVVGQHGFIGHLVGGEVSRTLEGERCEDVVRGLALVAALAIEPEPAPAPAAAASASPAAASAASAPAEVAVEVPVAARRAPLVLRVGAGVALVGGAVPDASLGVPLYAELSGAREVFAVRLSVASLHGDAALATDTMAADFSLLVASLEGCALPLHLAGARIGGCAAFEVGRLVAEGRDLAAPRREVRPWLAPVALARARWALGGRVVVEVAAGAAVPLVRERFVAAPDAVLHEPAAIGLRTSADIGVSFW